MSALIHDENHLRTATSLPLFSLENLTSYQHSIYASQAHTSLQLLSDAHLSWLPNISIFLDHPVQPCLTLGRAPFLAEATITARLILLWLDLHPNSIS
jgi:hypothetical protein